MRSFNGCGLRGRAAGPDVRRQPPARGGFSLVELIIVIVIIGLIAAIAVPRFARAGQSAGEAALRADLKKLRDAIELYTVEHQGDWPAFRGAGDGVSAHSGEAFERQLTWYTSPAGTASRTPDDVHTLGPYLHRIPPLPVGRFKGADKVISLNFVATGTAVSDAQYGWQYGHYMSNIRANCAADEIGSNGIPYNEW